MYCTLLYISQQIPESQVPFTKCKGIREAKINLLLKVNV